MKTCTHCGAPLPIGTVEDTSVICPYCGAKHMATEVYSDDVKIAHIEAQTQLAVEKSRREEREKEVAYERENKEKNSFKQSKINWLWLVFSLWSLLLSFVCIDLKAFLSIGIGIVQSILFGTAWWVGRTYHDRKQKDKRTIMIVVSFILILPFLLSINP